MRWIVKAAVQRVIGALPRAEALNYELQRRVTKTIPRSDESFLLHARETMRHFRAFVDHAETEPQATRFYEFGAGWDLITPLLYRALGVGHQTLVDIRPNLRFEAVNASLQQLERNREELQAESALPLTALPSSEVRSTADLARLGISYLAPRDARDTGLQAESFDFASSTFTLEHIPERDIGPIFTECIRLLRPGGVMSSAVDMQDHYSYVDPRISGYNFLRFSEATWRLVNSPIHYQNRLRLPDYERLVREAGFEILESDVSRGSEADAALLGGLKLAPPFRSYETPDLTARGATFVTVKLPRASGRRSASG